MCMACMTATTATLEAAALVGAPVAYAITRRVRRAFGMRVETYADTHAAGDPRHGSAGEAACAGVLPVVVAGDRVDADGAAGLGCVDEAVAADVEAHVVDVAR